MPDFSMKNAVLVKEIEYSTRKHKTERLMEESSNLAFVPEITAISYLRQNERFLNLVTIGQEAKVKNLRQIVSNNKEMTRSEAIRLIKVITPIPIKTEYVFKYL